MSQSCNRRDIDVVNDWVRMECIDGDGTSSGQMLERQLKGLEFISELPMVNSSSIVISGQFNFSRN